MSLKRMKPPTTTVRGNAMPRCAVALVAIACAAPASVIAAQPSPPASPTRGRDVLSILADGKALEGRFVSCVDGRVIIELPDGTRGNVAIGELGEADRKKVAELENTDSPGIVPPWVPGYRVRYTLRVLGDVWNTPSKTIVARIPTGGWLRPDATDIRVCTASGKAVAVAVVSHDPKGDTLIQFRNNGTDRWYWVYAMNPGAPPRDEALFARIDQTRKEEAASLIRKMEAHKSSAERQVEFRNITAEVEKQKAIVAGVTKELETWAKLLPEREAAAVAAQKKAAEAAPVVATCKTDEQATAAVAQRKAAAAKPSGDAAAAARAKAGRSQAGASASAKALAELQARVVQADATARARMEESVAADRALAAAKTPQEREAARKTATESAAAAKAAQAAARELGAKVPATRASSTSDQAVAAADDAAAKAAEQAAAGPAAESQAARMAAAKATTLRTEAEANLGKLTAASTAAQAQVAAARQAIANATTLRNTARGLIDQLAPKFDAMKAAAEAAMAASAKAVEESDKKTKQLFDLAADADPTVFKEGLTVEYREWAGDRLADWPSVVEGLLESDNVLGNALVTQVLQNANPFRRSKPRNFAASYRGHLKITTPGVYSFYVNGDDAAFLFINGYRVYTRTGTNTPVRGRIPTYSIGSDIELDPGIHHFEVHSVIGNTPWATGLCTFMWLAPGAKAWTFVPESAFVQGCMATPVLVEEASGGQVAVLDFGMDDALVSDGVSLYLARFEAQGTITNPAALRWDFGDGTTAAARSVSHIYFREGDYEVSLHSGGGLPPFRRRFHVWSPPTPTSPLSLARAVETLSAANLERMSVPQLNSVFDFLLICEQPNRWPLLERVCRLLLSKPGLDVKYRVLLNTRLMESLASQGRSDEALRLMEPALAEVARVQTLRGRILLRAAEINRTSLKDFRAANELYTRILTDYRRLKHPVVISAAVSSGDMYLEGGDQARAGEAYRLAQALRSGDAMAETQGDAVRRGALLRVAEQQLKAGDIRQTRRMLQRIEQEFPEQKLEGLYRYLRAETDRAAGRYDDAIRNYEVLLQLRAWAGYRAQAEFGLADSHSRMGDYGRALDGLAALERDFPGFFAERKLGDYRKQVESRRDVFKPAEAAGTPPDAPAREPATPFAGVSMGFEPEHTAPLAMPAACRFIPSLGLDGSYTAFIEATRAGVQSSIPPIPITNLPGQGTLWVEFWYRELQGPATPGDTRAIRVGVHDGAMAQVSSGTLVVHRTFGLWQKAAFSMAVPRTINGHVTIAVDNHQGLLQIDGLRVMPVSDTLNDALRTFIEGADPQ